MIQIPYSRGTHMVFAIKSAVVVGTTIPNFFGDMNDLTIIN
jgi:hypothetical protein